MPSLDPRRRRGRYAEELATWWLRARGWSVPLRDARIGGVQVDLVARRGRIEALVEVKARLVRSRETAPPARDLLSTKQLQRLTRAAESRAHDGTAPLTVRVDLVTVVFGLGLPRLQHFEGLEARSDFQPRSAERALPPSGRGPNIEVREEAP